MKNLIDRTHTFTMLRSRLVAMVLSAALLFAVPFNAALAADAPDLGTADSFAVLGGTAVTLTGSTINGDVGSPTAVTVTTSAVFGTVYPAADSIAIAAYNDFFAAYDELAAVQCGTTLTGDLPGLVLPPGVYCVEAASTTGRATFGFNAQPDKKGGVKGHFNYVNHETGLHVNGAVTSIQVIAVNMDGSPKTVLFSGTWDGGSFFVTVEDNGEPGRTDEFGITVTGEPEVMSQRVISSGNIQFHK